MILHKRNGRDKLAIIILKPNDDGGFYSVVSAFVSREGYFQKYKLLWERAQSNRPVAGAPSAISGQSSLLLNTSKIVTESAIEIKKKTSEEPGPLFWKESDEFPERPMAKWTLGKLTKR
ncbi:MAG: hypothetical protein AB1656_15965 [Candidatus Omnitrophota bacterium]